MAFVDARPVADGRSVVNLGGLAVLRPLLDKLNIASIIDAHLPTQADVSHGTVLAILLAARLECPTALVNVAQWAQEHGVEYLWNVSADKLNDDRLARALDAFFDQRHAILAGITHEVLRVTQLTLDRCHFDTTHLVLYGAYESSGPRQFSSLARLLSERRLDNSFLEGPSNTFRASDTPMSQAATSAASDIPMSPTTDADTDADASASATLDPLIRDIASSPAHITHGYLTRYKMLQLGVTSVVDDLGPVPVACHLLDGNRNGHPAIAQQYHLMRQFLGLPDNFLLVSDRGTCSAEHLARLLRHKHHAVCAGQWQDYRGLFEQHADRLVWTKASYLSREQQRRRDSQSSLPREEYRLTVVNHQLVDPLTKSPFDCRVIFVHSSAAAKESKERRDKNVALIKAGLAKLAAKLERAHPCTTPETITKQVGRLLGTKAAAKHFTWQLVPLTDAERTALPPPKKGYSRQSHRLEFSCDEAGVQAESRDDGIQALVTTAPLTWNSDDLFTEYKRQTYVERGHHELKTPIAVTPIFLKTPRRIEALISLLFVALQASMTLERLYRQRVPQDAPAQEQRMTAERIMQQFDVCGLTVEHHTYGDLVKAAALTPEQRRILNKLSLATPQKILQQNLAPPPT